MRVAEVLSDLSSLKVCDPTAAISLVSARPSEASNTSSVEAVKKRTDTLLSAQQESDPDLQRAKDLVSLHYAVKIKHLNKGSDGGVAEDESLEDARYAVKAALEEMGQL